MSRSGCTAPPALPPRDGTGAWAAGSSAPAGRLLEAPRPTRTSPAAPAPSDDRADRSPGPGREGSCPVPQVWGDCPAVNRCCPPGNRPTPEERDNCLPYLVWELRLLDRGQVIVCLGAFAWDGAVRAI